MSYSDITINDPNFIKRYLQRSRFRDAVALFRKNSEGSIVLDFGGADGELCLQLARHCPNSRFICYEPIPDIYEQARENTSGHGSITLLDNLETLLPESIDVIYALEVFEHLPDKEYTEAFAAISLVLKPGGSLIIGVPNELFVAAIYKGLFRLFRRFGEFDAQVGNILRSAIGRPPRIRPVGSVVPGKEYHFYHMGFDHRLLHKKLNAEFKFIKRVFSPLRFIGAWASPEIYYVVQKVNH